MSPNPFNPSAPLYETSPALIGVVDLAMNIDDPKAPLASNWLSDWLSGK